MKSFFRTLVLIWLSLVLIHPLKGDVLSDILATNLRVEYKNNPIIDDLNPRLSWELTSEVYNQKQSAYQIVVSRSEESLMKNADLLWDSGIVKSSQTNQVEYAGPELKSGEKVWWKIRVWDKNSTSGKWSDVASWEMGKLNNDDWEAKWIGMNTNKLAKPGTFHLPPSPYVRKEEGLEKKVKRARLYVTSLGLYEFYINGRKIGDDYFAPGWTDYNKRLYYNVYDVTSELIVGNNVFGAILSNGWYAGYLGYAKLVGSPITKQFYGEFPLLKAQIEIEYMDGSRKVVKTDESWKSSIGALLESDILHGETYDARAEPIGWSTSFFNDKNWKSVFVDEYRKDPENLQVYPGEPVRVVDKLDVVNVSSAKDGRFIFDFGQNFAGTIELHVKGNKGDTLVFRYGEMLYPDGEIVVENLRMARATDTYILRGDEEGEVWRPKFTYHGFQYVEISGLKETPSNELIKGLVMSSDIKSVGSFETDNKMVNQLYSNILWTQRANYFDIPTDCPQRDERQGWTCDAQIYIGSAKFNNDISAFFKKWIRDLNDAQWENGAYPVYAPMPQKDQVALIRESDTYSPGWSDAGIICPYEIYATYGDTRVIRESLPYMKQYMEFLKRKSDDTFVLVEDSFHEIEPRGGFGDWLSVGSQTSPDLLASIYYYHNARLMVEMCEAVGDGSAADHYKSISEKIRVAFKQHYMRDDGTFVVDREKYNGYQIAKGEVFSGHTQSAYANAIYFNILEGEDLIAAGNYLRELIEENQNKLATGFLGFKPLFPALSATGSKSLAHELFLSTEYPSLGYEVANGATSIWERWDSYTKDKGFIHNAAMNSFSHYAFGAVNEWMFESIAGIRRESVGYKSFRIKPEIVDSGISMVKCNYESIVGKIVSNWERKNDILKQEVEVPVNTTAYCHFVNGNISDIKINGHGLTDNNYVLSVSKLGEEIIVELGSGKYTFTSTIQGD